MIFLFPHPTTRVSKLDRLHTGRPRKRDNMPTGEGKRWEPNHTTAARKPGLL
jgi:hypothetical protein